MPFAFRHLVVKDPAAQQNFEQLQVFLTEQEAQGASAEAARARVVQERVLPGAWTALVLAEALEFNVAGYEPAARTEQGGTSTRLRGILKVKAGKELTAGTTACTLAASYRPSKTVIMVSTTTTPAVGYVQVSSAGVVSCDLTLKAGEQLALDGITFSLT